MAVKVGINGFGRIGRNIFRTSLGDPDIDFVAVNDLTDTRTLAHLLKYDSVLGNLDHKITSTENGISVEGEEFRVFSQRDPAAIDWESVGAEIVIESTVTTWHVPECRRDRPLVRIGDTGPGRITSAGRPGRSFRLRRST